MAKKDTTSDDKGDGRRSEDRRKSQQPFDGPDRRKGDRRSGDDRRQQERHSGADKSAD